MTWLGRVLRLFAGNVVPGGGFLFAGWSPATALTLYWIDNLVGSAAMGVRIALHRRWTGASGHDRAQLGATMSGGTGHARRDVGFRSFVAEFLLTSLAFSIAQGVFLAFLLGGIMNALPSGDEVRQGGVGIIVAHVAALTFDARRLASWPFARLKDQREPPRLLARLLDRFPGKRDETFSDYWRRTHAHDRAQAQLDEQPPLPVPPAPLVLQGRKRGKPDRP